ncbi:MAG: hypothetical protein IM600_10755 [Bacteroidetes bacterium]|nr:hypothetical protein [Bacteroidota bacterium]
MLDIPENTDFNRKRVLFFSRKEARFNNTISFEPTLLVNGFASFWFERYLTHDFSFSLGVGNQLYNDPIYFMKYFNQVTFNLELENFLNISDIYSCFKERNYGYFMGIKAKYYVDGDKDFIEGGYFMASVRMFKSSYKIDSVKIRKTVSARLVNEEENFNLTDVNVNLSGGMMFHTNTRIKTVHDISAGIGIRISGYNGIQTNERSIFLSNDPKEVTITNSLQVLFNLGFYVSYNIGIGF